MKHSVIRQFTTRSITSLGLALLAGSLIACSAHQSEPKTLSGGASCQQLGSDNPVLTRFYEPGTVLSAKPIEKRIFLARGLQPERTMGATLYVSAQPDVNGPYLRRVLACHVDAKTSAHPNDPLHPSTGQVKKLDVRPSGNGYIVSVEADQPRVGEEIWNRAKAFSEQRTAVQVQQVSGAPQHTPAM